jgi:hypothetical protein
MHEDVKFKFISYVCLTAQKRHIEIRYIKTIMKAFIMNYNVKRCLERS